MKKLYLIAYDIPCKRRARKALNIMKDYSHNGQKSVFECWLSKKDLFLLRTRLAEILHPQEDHLLLTALPLTRDFHYLGRARPHHEPAIMIR